MSNEMIKHEAAIAYRTATNVAGICKAIVLQTAVEIQHRKYVRVEGWQAIAGAHGCVASAKDVERIQGGIRAIGEIRRGDTGAVLATAEGFVGDDEDTWGQRPEYAKRAMAQTRAISRACRSAFAHVVVMMNAGLETTPAEEVPMEGFTPPSKLPEKKVEAVSETLAKKPEAQPCNDGTPEKFTVELVIGKVCKKDGVDKNGKPNTRFYTKASDNNWYSTFDTTIGARLEAFAGDNALLTYEVRGKFLTIVGIDPIPDPSDEPAEPEQDPDRHRKDNIPF